MSSKIVSLNLRRDATHYVVVQVRDIRGTLLASSSEKCHIETYSIEELIDMEHCALAASAKAFSQLLQHRR